MNNLVSLLALPAMWTGHDPSRVTTTLLDVLVEMLDLDFAYVRASNAGGASPKEWIRLAHGSRDASADEIGRALAPYLTHGSTQASPRIANPVAEGTASITVFHLGTQDTADVFVAGSRRSEFPTESERLLLQVATNQAAIALQEVWVEERFRTTTDPIPEVIWITALEPERVLYTSPSFEEIWGLSVDDLYRNPRLWTETIHPEDRDRVSNAFSLWITGADVSYDDIEYRIVRPDGDIRWIHERGVLARDENGRPVGVSGISTDITERKRGERALQRSEGYLAAAQRLSRTGSFGWMPSSGEIVWSEETYRMFALDRTTKPSVEFVLLRVHRKTWPSWNRHSSARHRVRRISISNIDY